MRGAIVALVLLVGCSTQAPDEQSFTGCDGPTAVYETPSGHGPIITRVTNSDRCEDR
jgi:hypothetical protein